MRGRPRTFDEGASLDKAMRMFWELGYEGSSMDALTASMGISASSLYATFGGKEMLFRRALERYLDGPGSYVGPILTSGGGARETFARLFARAAEELTKPGQPRGCMVSLALTHCSQPAEAVRESLREMRARAAAALARRIRRGMKEGDMPASTDARALATFVMSVLQGMSAQARDGASREALQRIGEIAMRAWPGM